MNKLGGSPTVRFQMDCSLHMTAVKHLLVRLASGARRIGLRSLAESVMSAIERLEVEMKLPAQAYPPPTFHSSLINFINGPYQA